MPDYYLVDSNTDLTPVNKPINEFLDIEYHARLMDVVDKRVYCIVFRPGD